MRKINLAIIFVFILEKVCAAQGLAHLMKIERIDHKTSIHKIIELSVEANFQESDSDYDENLDNSDSIAKLPLRDSYLLNNDFFGKTAKVKTTGRIIFKNFCDKSGLSSRSMATTAKTTNLRAFGNPIIININSTDNPENPIVEFFLSKNAKRNNEGKLPGAVRNFIDCLSDNEEDSDIQLRMIPEKK